MKVLEQFDESRFWKRLDDLSSDGSYSGDEESLDHLKASVRKVAKQAKWINSQVESLYGDPIPCIRELLQNPFELRELRLNMKQKGEAHEPVDGELVREPDGHEFSFRNSIFGFRVSRRSRVVGMTEEVIKNYFTQIGKSYYRTPEFKKERAAMKADDELVSHKALAPNTRH